MAAVGEGVSAGGGTVAGTGIGLSCVDSGGSGVDTAVGEGVGSAWVQAITRTKQTHILINECFITIYRRFPDVRHCTGIGNAISPTENPGEL